MKIKCEKIKLCDAAAVVSRAVSSRSPLPVLEGLLLRADKNGLSLYGYDLDIGISTTIEVQTEQPGEIVLPAKVLLDIVRRLPGETVTISADAKALCEIQSGASQFTILGMTSEEFPEFPQCSEGEALPLNETTLRSMIAQTGFAVSQADAKPVHTGSLFDMTGEELCLVSVDGYRLALRREPLAGDPRRFVVPGRTLTELSRILTDEGRELQLHVSKKHVFFTIGEYRIFSRLLEGDFLDYRAAIPNGGGMRVRVNTRVFIDAVERVSLLISDRIKSPLRVRFDNNGEILLSCSTTLGKANDIVAAAVEGDTLEMGFNHRYLLDALRAADCDEVQLEMGGALSPMKVLPVQGDSFVFLVLPVRLKTDL